MNLLIALVPAIFALLLLEWGFGVARHRRVYQFPDLMTDLGCSAMTQVIGIAVTAITVGAYGATTAFLSARGWSSPASFWTSPVAWLAVFLIVDLGQYLTHRLSHRVNLLWACHSVHHSSRELNYGVALRNSAFHGFFIWVAFLPLAVAGVPWEMVGLCYTLNVLYQFWLHTRLIGRLGPLEAVFNTPSHHRVHHGMDPKYLDRNFGGVFIIWDRLWGTFQREEEEPSYGTVDQVASWNPLWANVHGFALIAAAWREAGDWPGRLRAVFGPPESLHGMRPSPPPHVPSPRVLWYAFIQLLAAIAATLMIVLSDAEPEVRRVIVALLVLATLGVVGALLDGRRWALPAEGIRLAMIAAFVATAGRAGR